MIEPTTPDEDEAFNEIERISRIRQEIIKRQMEPSLTQKEYERGFIDGMQKQLQSDVTRVMEGGTRNQVIEEVAQHIEKLTGFGQDTISSFAIYIRGMKK